MGYTTDGLGALIFTADGDMRNALNNLQSTYTGYRYINEANVFKVCDQPHPLIARTILEGCVSLTLFNWMDGWMEGEGLTACLFQVSQVQCGRGQRRHDLTLEPRFLCLGYHWHHV